MRCKPTINARSNSALLPASSLAGHLRLPVQVACAHDRWRENALPCPGCWVAHSAQGSHWRAHSPAAAAQHLAGCPGCGLFVMPCTVNSELSSSDQGNDQQGCSIWREQPLAADTALPLQMTQPNNTVGTSLGPPAQWTALPERLGFWPGIAQQAWCQALGVHVWTMLHTREAGS